MKRCARCTLPETYPGIRFDSSGVCSLCPPDGQTVRVTTAAGSETGELEVSDQVRQGMILIPHGFGLIYDGNVYGLNVNRLTGSRHRDPLTGTPLHRFVPCRIEAA